MLLRLLIALLLIYLLFRIIRTFTAGKKKISGAGKPAIEREDMVEDPFCHLHVPISMAYKMRIEDRTAFFCSRECMEKYRDQYKRR